ncbi:hypothetical protein HK102_002707, partial [Quaeritorhiza haematococci]
IQYQVQKHRKGRGAPEGSGVPVGTEYEWLIVAHQNVKKIDANTYDTILTGTKYKLAHKRAGSESWNLRTKASKRKREIRLLEDVIRRVEEGEELESDEGGGEKRTGENRESGGGEKGRKGAGVGGGKKRNVVVLEKGQRTLLDMFGKPAKAARKGDGNGKAVRRM